MTGAATDPTPPVGRWRRLRAAPGGLAEAIRLVGLGLGLVVRAAPRPTAVVVAVTLVLIGLPVAQVWLSREVIDSLVDANGSGAGRAVLLPAVLYAATIVLPVLLAPLRQTVEAIIEDRAVPLVDREIMAAVARHPDLTRIERPAFHDEARLLGQVVGVIPLLLLIVQSLGGALLTLTGVAVLLAGLHPLIPVAIVLSLVPQVIAQQRSMATYYLALSEQSRAGREMDDAVRVLTTPDAAREVRVLGLGGFFLARFEDRYRAAIGEMQPIRLRLLRAMALLSLPLAVAVAGSLWYVADRAAAGRMTPGDIALFLNAILQIGVLASVLAGFGGFLATTIPPLRMLNRFRRSARPGIAIATPGEALTVPDRLAEGLSLDGVRFAYPAGEDVLLDVAATLPAGRVTALVGANGAGKSTIVNLLTRMYDPTAGVIRLDGEPLARYDLDALRGRTAATFQGFARFALTLRDNIVIGGYPDDVTDDGLARAAAWSGADEVAAGLPDSYDTQLTRYFKGGVELSGGQWQRVALARSALRDATIVILDEPNAALDPEAEARQIARLHEVAAGRTTLIISHRLSTVRHADHIVVLDGGRVTERGTHDELIALGGEYARLFAMQADRFR